MMPYGFSDGYIIPGMGYLVFKSGFIPKIVGVLLVIAGVGYMV
jgi:hypothetical protein